MNLYRLIVIKSPNNLERGVWAEDMIISNDVYFFRNRTQNDKLVAAYPSRITIITSVETKEEHEAAQKRRENAMTDVTGNKW